MSNDTLRAVGGDRKSGTVTSEGNARKSNDDVGGTR